jgi:UrcA family protein
MTRQRMNVRQGVLIALSAMFAATAASAGDTQVSAEVTVQAERPTAKVVDRTAVAPVILAAVDYRVSYSDLDLSIPSNAKVLKTRVRDAARGACADLDRLYPISSGNDECSRKAEERAMPQVLSAIAAAESRKTAAD